MSGPASGSTSTSMSRSNAHIDGDSEVTSWKTVVRALRLCGKLHGDIDTEKLNKQMYDITKQSADASASSAEDLENLAVTAYQKGDHNRGHYLKQEAIKLRKKEINAKRMAGFMQLELRSKAFENPILLDLHGQNVPEAVSYLKIILWAIFKLRAIRALTVITGHGKNRLAQQSELREAVINLSISKGIKCDPLPGNDGRLKLSVSQTKKDLDLSDSDSDSDID